MVVNDKLIEDPDIVNNKIEYDRQMKEIQEQIVKKFKDYRNTINYMAADAPIETLCLAPAIEKALLDHGLLRIYDLLDCDLTKVKRLGVRRIDLLTTSLNQFFSML